jgi:hypothetical protein
VMAKLGCRAGCRQRHARNFHQTTPKNKAQRRGRHTFFDIRKGLICGPRVPVFDPFPNCHP